MPIPLGKGGLQVRTANDLRILLVDDEPALRELLRVTFEGAEVTVREAATGEEALDALAAELPDAIVLDLRLPGIDGAELCRRVRRDPRMCRLPIVVLSGGDDDELERARKAGADEVVRKPFSPLELALDRRAARRARGLAAGAPSRGRPARGGAPALRARPPAPDRGRARAAAPASRKAFRADRLGARGRARVEGPRQRAALAPRARVRGVPPRADRARRCSTATRESSTASSSTTSARSASPTRSSASAGC